jgi:hypothetical protein
MMTSVNGLSWSWIALGATVPALIALILAMPLWRRSQAVLGSIAGTVVIFGSAIGLILREYVVLDGLSQDCLDAGSICWPVPTAFTRFAIYAAVAMFEVFVLFILSLKFEERRRRRDYAPEWQR